MDLLTLFAVRFCIALPTVVVVGAFIFGGVQLLTDVLIEREMARERDRNKVKK